MNTKTTLTKRLTAFGLMGALLAGSFAAYAQPGDMGGMDNRRPDMGQGGGNGGYNDNRGQQPTQNDGRWNGDQRHPPQMDNRQGERSQQAHGNYQRMPMQAHNFRRGGRLPPQYRGNYGYRYEVADWNAYPRLYAPPRGAHWMMTVDGDFILASILTGVIYSIIRY